MEKLTDRPVNPLTESMFFLENYVDRLEKYCDDLEMRLKLVNHQYEMACHELSYHGLTSATRLLK